MGFIEGGLLTSVSTNADGEYSLQYTEDGHCDESRHNLVARKTAYKEEWRTKLMFDLGNSDSCVK